MVDDRFVQIVTRKCKALTVTKRRRNNTRLGDSATISIPATVPATRTKPSANVVSHFTTTATSGAVSFAAICAVSCALQKFMLDQLALRSAPMLPPPTWHSTVLTIPMGFATVAVASCLVYYVTLNNIPSLMPRHGRIRQRRGGGRRRLTQQHFQPPQNVPFARIVALATSSTATTIQNSASVFPSFSSSSQRHRYPQWNKNPAFNRNNNNRHIISSSSNTRILPWHTLMQVCTVGLVSFVVLSSLASGLRRHALSQNPLSSFFQHYGRIGPSSYVQVGSFGSVHRSLAATEQYATPAQRKVLVQWGRRYGCHTCGSRGITKNIQRTLSSMMGQKGSSSAGQLHSFVGDHMPPKSMAARLLQQAKKSSTLRQKGSARIAFRFYPQCVSCSNTQGSLLSAVSKTQQKQVSLAKSSAKTAIKSLVRSSSTSSPSYYCFHGLRPRLYHLTGSVVALWTQATTTPSASASSPRR